MSKTIVEKITRELKGLHFKNFLNKNFFNIMIKFK